ncbi:MAG: DUF167 domain-containing protein [Chloroflexi bacterium]|nr:DUF167 domain-containing protein [Chloroflexota bacterium]
MTGVTLTVRVQPGARRNALDGVEGGALRIAVTAPAHEGRANEAVVALLAEALALPKSAISVFRGSRSRSKVLRIEGLTKEALVHKIDSLQACVYPRRLGDEGA